MSNGLNAKGGYFFLPNHKSKRQSLTRTRLILLSDNVYYIYTTVIQCFSDLFEILLIHLLLFPVVDPGFTTGGGANRKGEYQPIILANVHPKCLAPPSELPMVPFVFEAVPGNYHTSAFM